MGVAQTSFFMRNAARLRHGRAQLPQPIAELTSPRAISIHKIRSRDFARALFGGHQFRVSPRDHLNVSAYHGPKLWTALTLEKFARGNLDEVHQAFGHLLSVPQQVVDAANTTFQLSTPQLQVGQRVRVLYNDQWERATVIRFECDGLQVICTADRRVHDNLDFFEGHGISVGNNSASLDPRDSNTHEAYNTPQARVPHIQPGTSIGFTYFVEAAIAAGIMTQHQWYEGVVGNAINMRDTSFQLTLSGSRAQDTLHFSHPHLTWFS